MSDAPIVIQRPQRWDNPFSREMSDGDVDRALAVGPLSRVDPDEFPASASLRDIVRNDSRINRYGNGDIVIRAGDYSNSAFVVLAGKVRVVVEPMLDDDFLGRPKVRKKDLLTAFSQLWRNSKLPEFRDFRRYQRGASVGLRRTDSDETRVFLQDLPRILEDHRTVELGVGEMFGEIATIARTPRTTTVFADGEAELVELRIATLATDSPLASAILRALLPAMSPRSVLAMANVAASSLGPFTLRPVVTLSWVISSWLVVLVRF